MRRLGSGERELDLLLFRGVGSGDVLLLELSKGLYLLQINLLVNPALESLIRSKGLAFFFPGIHPSRSKGAPHKLPLLISLPSPYCPPCLGEGNRRDITYVEVAETAEAELDVRSGNEERICFLGVLAVPSVVVVVK